MEQTVEEAFFVFFRGSMYGDIRRYTEKYGGVFDLIYEWQDRLAIRRV